jgi:CheY-like chemotaxis protein
MAARILVVDDEPSIVKLVTATLEPKGYTIDKAYNGSEAIALAKLHKPDLVLLDITMPGMDGREVRKRLFEDRATKDIPVIHLTAMGAYDQQKQAFAEGVTDYIVKPFTPSDLAQQVADWLDPTKRDQMIRQTRRKQGQIRAIVDIMHREEDK